MRASAPGNDLTLFFILDGDEVLVLATEALSAVYRWA